MIIKFLDEIEVEVVVQFDEEADEIAESHNEIFHKDEEIECDVIDFDDDSPSVQIQFADGSVAFFPKECFEIIEK